MVAAGVSGPPRRGRARALAAIALWSLIGLAALLLLAKSAQNSSEFGRLQPWIVLLNVIGVFVLIVLLARRL